MGLGLKDDDTKQHRLSFLHSQPVPNLGMIFRKKGDKRA
jgi:hypothetical protein